MEPVFNSYSEYYNLFYHDKDYNGEVEYINKLLKRFEAPGKKILELGSGTGIHGSLLAKKGYTVDGIELSPTMVEQSISCDGFTNQIGDIRNHKLSNKDYDIAISLFHVVSYQTSNNDINSLFKNVFEHIKPGGLFVFDTWYSPAVLSLGVETRIKRAENENVKIQRVAESKIEYRNNKVDVNFTIGVLNKKDQTYSEFNELHPMRYFSEPEIKMLAQNNGFEFIHSEEFVSGNKPNANTWGVCFILRRI